MPATTKIVKIDDSLSIEQATLKRGKAITEKQTKHDIDSSLMTFFKIVINEKSPIMVNFHKEVNMACENLAKALSKEYNPEVFDELSGDGFFTEVIEGMKKYCSIAFEKVQSDARRTILIDSGQVPAELWEADTVTKGPKKIDSSIQGLLAGLKKK